MAGYRKSAALAVLAAVAAGAGLSGCSGDSSAAPDASKAASAAVSKAASAASSLASKGTGALASASAEAKRRLDEVKKGAQAKDDVKLGTPTTATGGRATVDVTAKNTADAAKSFAVQVNFTDTSGNLLDTAVVTVSKVAAGQTGKATATSNRNLTGQVKAEVARALRY
ncbi:FxLYD domain-containing protein [Streptomyces sp. NPDC005209]|uniref:FxLYD domain-containing protein n=1 Tax=Streptomyces sp. NPDC005209 TaxID=3156715 RepID=UPI0033B281B5